VVGRRLGSLVGLREGGREGDLEGVRVGPKGMQEPREQTLSRARLQKAPSGMLNPVLPKEASV